MVWLILAAIFLALLSIILLTRLRIVIDSYGNIARISWGRAVHLSLTQKEDLPILRLWAFGLKRDWVLFELLLGNNRASDTKEKTGRDVVKKKKRGRSRITFRRVMRMTSSFRIHTFKVDLDTDDYVLNAYLYPIVEIMRYRGVNVSVNFNGINGIVLDISNRPVRMLVAWLK